MTCKWFRLAAVLMAVAVGFQTAGAGIAAVAASAMRFALQGVDEIPKFTDRPGRVWLGFQPGRDELHRGGFYTDRALLGMAGAQYKWLRRGQEPLSLYASITPPTLSAPAGGGGGGLPGEGRAPGGTSGGGIINTANGNMMKEFPLVGWESRGGMGIDFTLYHNSLGDYDQEFGYGWSITYGAKLDVQTGINGETVTIRWGDGTVCVHAQSSPTGPYSRPPGVFDNLAKLTSGNYRITKHDGTQVEFNPPKTTITNDLGDIVSITDRNGNTITVTTGQFIVGSNTVERPVQVTDPTGNRYLTLAYGTDGRVQSLTDSASSSRVWTFTYSYGDLEYLNLPLLGGYQYNYHFVYDTHRITDQYDLEGKRWQASYDISTGKILWTKDPLNHQTTYAYSTTATTITEPGASGTIIHNYDSGVLASEVDEESYSLSYKVYNSDRLPTTIIDKRGGQILLTYDANGNLLTKTNQLGKTWIYTYNSTNDLLTVQIPTNTDKQLWKYAFDTHGNLTQVTDPEGKRVLFAGYNAYGDVSWTKDANNHQTDYAYYSSTGLLNTITDPYNHVTTLHYDLFARMDWSEDALGNRTTFDYDAWGRRTKVTYPNTHTSGPADYVQIQYDRMDRVTAVIDERLKTSSFAYNDAGWLTDTYNANNENEHYTYNARGWVTAVRNGRNYTRNYYYTARGDLWGMKLPDNTGEGFSHDGNGNVTQYETRTFGFVYNYQRRAYTYDDADRLTLIDYLGAMTNVSFVYDDSDRQTSMVDGTGTTSWQYYLNSAVKRMNSPQGNMVYDYDSDARLWKLTEKLSEDSPPGTDLVTTTLYDNAGRLASVNKFGETTQFAYDNASRISRMTYASTAYADYVYDQRSRITGIFHKDSSGAVLAKEENTFDDASRIVQRISGGVTSQYGYDDIGQLTSESDGTGYSAAYTHDANGNRATRTLNGITETYTNDSGDKLTSVAWTDSQQVSHSKTYAYHFSGRCTSITLDGVATSLSWDKESRITGITQSGAPSASYAYNALDARVSKTVGSTTTTFKREGADPVSPVLSDTTGSSAARYLPGISERRGGASTYYHSGIKNSISQTDLSQGIASSKRYDAFGNLASGGSGWNGPFAYGGQFGYQTDDEFGLKLLGHRYYDSASGRFLSRDYAAKDGRNWYAYCEGDSLGFADEDGQQRVRIIQKILDGLKRLLSKPKRMPKVRLLPPKTIADAFKNSDKLRGLKPEQVGDLIGDAKKQGWKLTTLSQGGHKSQGFKMIEVLKNGKEGNKYIRWHPGGGHHGEKPYWKLGEERPDGTHWSRRIYDP